VTNIYTLASREPPFRGLQMWVKTAKTGHFRPVNLYILEMIENRHTVTVED